MVNKIESDPNVGIDFKPSMNKNNDRGIGRLEEYNSLSKFGTKLNGDAQRVKFTHLQTRYRVRFVGFGQDAFGANWIDTGYSCNLPNYRPEDLTMDMKEFSAPSGSFTNQTIEAVNGTINYPGKWTWQSIQFKVYNSYDNANYKALYRQIEQQRDLYDQTTGTVPSNYKFKTIFEHTDGHQNAVAFWVMEGCYLLKAVPQGGNNGNYDATTIDCELQFDNALLVDYDGELITGYGAKTSFESRFLATNYKQ